MDNLANIIKLRMKITIKKKVKYYEEIFLGKIIEINSDDIKIKLDEEEHISELLSGDNITFSLKQNSDIYYFQSLLLKNIADREVVISYPEGIYKTISRKHLRMDINLVTLFKQQKNRDSKLNKGITMDLSAEGMLLLTKIKMEIGEKLNISFDLTNGTSCDTIVGEIKRKEVLIEGGQVTKYIYGIFFVEILEDTKEQIIAYLFKLQKLRRKKGKK